ncbi:amino acid adenylation domain-containing protein [Cuneatibacter sp. NSJ-177]|uniref:amino acid adenylation domain-containing protein n=1 Tax=Cuneatibacter sp. NSJ-177 TaxID=2931401 RepID=UPI001FD2D470|nr:amino acid adenylation domain-containing protein [Cuneatibacter sp. NSJ-177]MCJ7835250.1 amino acid adenylation domain-containing protein [Cuneatibacter sp. NSJ-177]
MQQTNVLEYLERTAPRVPDKLAYANENMGLTFSEVYRDARAIGSFLSRRGHYREPVVVFMQKHPKMVVSFYGVIYSGCYYVPIDEEMPKHRIELIFQNLNPKAIICDDVTKEMVKEFHYQGEIYLYEEMTAEPADDEKLAEIRRNALDVDPIYIVFTSGSTGVPKGVVACHRSVIDYIDNLADVLEFDENSIFGNQTPLYFDACLKELYSTMKFGGTTYLIPKNLFMFPVKLVEFLNEYKINTVCWVVSALTMISAFKAFDKVKPQYLHTIAFGSEVFPIKQFNIWREALPDAKFVNLYGPTEGTGMCCYYKVDREFALDETIPIGQPFHNTEILLLDENNKPAKPGGPGEICIRGTSVTLGYYHNPEKTRESFVQNPLNDAYPEIIYRTGDLAKYNERGELCFLSRKDYQIKHMGHRIELGEIEVVVNMKDGIKSACCIFDDDKKKIVLYYVGEVSPADMVRYLKEKLPRYMIPNSMEVLETMPLTPNGKINRVLLKQNYMNKKEK